MIHMPHLSHFTEYVIPEKALLSHQVGNGIINVPFNAGMQEAPSLVLCWHPPVLPVAQHWVTSCLLCAPGPLQTTPPTITKVRQLVKKVFDPKQNLVKRTGPLPRPVGKECKVCCMCVCVCVCVRACVRVCVCACVRAFYQ